MRPTDKADEGIHCIAKTLTPLPLRQLSPPAPFSFSITEADSSVECVSDSTEPLQQTILASLEVRVGVGTVSDFSCPQAYCPPPPPSTKEGIRNCSCAANPQNNANYDFQHRCIKKSLRNTDTDSREPGTLVGQRAPQRARCSGRKRSYLEILAIAKKSGGTQLQPPGLSHSSCLLLSGFLPCLPSFLSAPSPPALGSLCQTRFALPLQREEKIKDAAHRCARIKKNAVSCKK